MAELTTLEEKLAEVTGLAMAAQGAGEKVSGLVEDDDLRQTLDRMVKEAKETEERCTQLAEGLDGEAVLVVPHRPADFHEHHVGLRLGRQLPKLQLHLAHHMGDDLHVAAEISARPLLLEHGREDLPVGREVGGAEVLVEAW